MRNSAEIFIIYDIIQSPTFGERSYIFRAGVQVAGMSLDFTYSMPLNPDQIRQEGYPRFIHIKYAKEQARQHFQNRVHGMDELRGYDGLIDLMTSHKRAMFIKQDVFHAIGMPEHQWQRGMRPMRTAPIRGNRAGLTAMRENDMMAIRDPNTGVMYTAGADYTAAENLNVTIGDNAGGHTHAFPNTATTEEDTTWQEIGGHSADAARYLNTAALHDGAWRNEDTEGR